MSPTLIAALLAAILATVFTYQIISRLRSTQLTLQQTRTRLQKIEETLKVKEDYLRTIIHSEPECVKLHKADGIVLDINPAGAALIEADTTKELIGTCIYDYIDPEDLDSYKQLTRHVFNGSSGTLEFKILSLKGKTRWMETHATPMRNNNGDIIALLGITRDITEKKHAEDADIQIRKRQEQLTRVCRILSAGEMASAFGHELNQPLCAIMNYAETIEEATKADEPDLDHLRSYAIKMARETERAGETVRRIRDFVSKREPKTSPLDINKLIGEVAEFLRPEAKRQQADIQYDPPGFPCFIEADSIQIQQVLINLITNGLDAMSDNPVGERIVVVSSDPVDQKLIKINVKDNGSGFGNADPQKIFNPFYTTKEGGVGIGLSISRSIAEAHGGYLKLFPNHDKGMNVVFALPKLAIDQSA